jgi:hypothetical protein
MQLALNARLAGAMLLASAATAQAAVDVFSQPPGTTYGDVSAIRNDPADPGFNWTVDSDEQAWVYFAVADSVSFNRITWYGSAADGDFALALFPATCFSCGLAPVGGSGNSANNLLPHNSAYTPASVSKVSLPSGMTAYSIDLPATLTLSGSPAYGLTVANNFTALPFLWASSGTGSGIHIHYIIGQAVVLPSPGNLAFTLTDTSAVPEPMSAELLALGLGVGLIGKTARRGLRGRRPD